MTANDIAALRLERQHLTRRLAGKSEYTQFARLIQPLTPPAATRPGNPPCLIHRAEFDDAGYNDMLRAGRTIVKGRFQGGNIGYVFADELELYAAAYKKDLKPDYKLSCILELLQREGPLTCHNIKELTGMLSREIMPALHKLQEAFLAYEDQVDSDWERGWYAFESEFPDVDLNRFTKQQAVCELVRRAAALLVFAELEHLKGWLRLPAAEIKNAVAPLIKDGILTQVECDGRQGVVLAADTALIDLYRDRQPEKSVFVLHRSDFLSKAFEQELKERFSGREILQYILVDGEFSGAVCGHWREGPHDVDDIALTLPEGKAAERKEEIVAAVALFYSPPFSHILRYNGKEL